jgi:copper transport protein
LEESPSEVVLEFTESVSSPPGGMRVLNQDGARVDTGAVDVDGSTITAPLEPGLPDGTYVVAWRAISADSHPVHGAFTFVVGDGPAADDAAIAALLGEGSDRPWQIAAAIARGVAYLGALLAAGAAVFMGVVEDLTGRTARRLLLGSAVAGVIGLLAALPIQAQLATGLGAGAIFREGVLGDVLADGVGASVVITTLGLAAIVVASYLTGGPRRPLFVAGAVAAVGGFAAAGHTTETTPKWLATASDVVHAGAGAAWFGGLVVLAIGLHRRRDEIPAGMILRFSRLATVAIVAIGVAGTALAWTEVRSLDALTSTTYGKLLIAKVAVIVVVALVGLYNRTRLVPAATRAKDTSRARILLGRTVAVEAGILVAAIALTAVLVAVTPARAAVSEPYSDTQPLGDGSANLVVDPARAGETAIHVYVLDDVGRPTELPEGSELSIDLRLPSADIGPIEAVPFVAGPGHYQVNGSPISVPGTWEITVSARVDRFEVETATFEVPIR